MNKGGRLIIVANTTDQDQIGNPTYRTMIHLLKMVGAERFNQLILSPDWVFIPDQWQAQMWTKLFAKIPLENLISFQPPCRRRITRSSPAGTVTFTCAGATLQGRPDGDPKVVSVAVAEEVSGSGRKRGAKRQLLTWLTDLIGSRSSLKPAVHTKIRVKSNFIHPCRHRIGIHNKKQAASPSGGFLFLFSVTDLL